MRVESSPLLDRADAVWSNPLLRQMFIPASPIGIQLRIIASSASGVTPSSIVRFIFST